MARGKLNKKMEKPSYENKGEFPILEDRKQSNLVEVIIAHDGLVVGQRFESNEGTIQKMEHLGYWKRV